MLVILRALVLLAGLFFVVKGIDFLIDPAGAGGDFGLHAAGIAGLASIRADMTALFLVTGIGLIWGGWARKGDPLLVSAALMGIALFGRLVTLVVDGPSPMFWFPMLVEAGIAILALIGSRMLPHHAFEPED